MADIGRSSTGHVETFDIESSQAWVELEHWGLWSSLINKPDLGFPRVSAGFSEYRTRYRETKGREPLRIGEDYSEARGFKADSLIAQISTQIHLDVIALSFDMQLADTSAAKVLSKQHCVRTSNGRPLPIDRKEYRTLKHQAVLLFGSLYNQLIAA